VVDVTATGKGCGPGPKSVVNLKTAGLLASEFEAVKARLLSDEASA
jgi:hypothetical protein